MSGSISSHSRTCARRLSIPSRRAGRADMSRTDFFRVAGAWSGAVSALLVIFTSIRFAG
jgi:hypothetical protein